MWLSMYLCSRSGAVCSHPATAWPAGGISDGVSAAIFARLLGCQYHAPNGNVGWNSSSDSFGTAATSSCSHWTAAHGDAYPTSSPSSDADAVPSRCSWRSPRPAGRVGEVPAPSGGVASEPVEPVLLTVEPNGSLLSGDRLVDAFFRGEKYSSSTSVSIRHSVIDIRSSSAGTSAETAETTAWMPLSALALTLAVAVAEAAGPRNAGSDLEAALPTGTASCSGFLRGALQQPPPSPPPLLFFAPAIRLVPRAAQLGRVLRRRRPHCRKQKRLPGRVSQPCGRGAAEPKRGRGCGMRQAS